MAMATARTLAAAALKSIGDDPMMANQYRIANLAILKRPIICLNKSLFCQIFSKRDKFLIN